MKDTKKNWELFKRLSNLREAEDKHKCPNIQHDLTKQEREEGRQSQRRPRQKI